MKNTLVFASLALLLISAQSAESKVTVTTAATTQQVGVYNNDGYYQCMSDSASCKQHEEYVMAACDSPSAADRQACRITATGGTAQGGSEESQAKGQEVAANGGVTARTGSSRLDSGCVAYYNTGKASSTAVRTCEIQGGSDNTGAPSGVSDNMSSKDNMQGWNDVGESASNLGRSTMGLSSGSSSSTTGSTTTNNQAVGPVGSFSEKDTTADAIAQDAREKNEREARSELDSKTNADDGDEGGGAMGDTGGRSSGDPDGDAGSDPN